MFDGARGLVGLAVACVLLAGCSASLSAAPASPDGPVLTGEAAGSDPVIASPIYALQVGEAAQASRIAQMAAIIDGLRAASSTGWQAKQGDRNGWAADVSGGWFRADGDPVTVTTAFMDSYGSVFGPAAGLITTSAGYDANGLATVRITQAVGTVPVDGALLTASVRQYGNGGQLESIRGLLLDTSGVTDTPTITATQAEATVTETLRATVTPGATLAIIDTLDGPRLAWAVIATAGPDPETGADSLSIDFPATVFVDAADSTILAARADSQHLVGTAGMPGEDGAAGSSVDYGNYSFTFPARGTPIVIDSDYLGLFPIQVTALRLPDGSIAMVDPTGPGADLTTKKGLIAVIDTQQHEVAGDALGEVAIYPDVASIPKDAIYSMWGVRQTLDLLSERFGLASFDGNNSPVPIVINYTEGDTCLDNAFFATAPGLSQMRVGVPCPDEAGRRRATMASIEVLGHEIGHGVTNSHTEFNTPKTVQQTALDEGTSDYIGMLARNAAFGQDGTILMSDVCQGNADWDYFCVQWKDGAGMRSMSTGATLDQYAYVLQDPLRSIVKAISREDGHDNGMVWTNALTQARRAVAAAAGEDPATSARARAFDAAVLRADTVYFEPNTGLVQAADAVMRAAADLGMSQQERDLIADRFTANKLCNGCEQIVGTQGPVVPVAVSVDLKSSPLAIGDRVAYILSRGKLEAITVIATPGDTAQQQVGPPASLSVHLSGQGTRLVQTQYTGNDSGPTNGSQLGEADVATGTYAVVTDNVRIAIAPAVSAKATVWVDGDNNVVYRRNGDDGQARKQFDVPVSHVATSGDRVAVVTEDATLWLWTVSTDTLQVLGQFDPRPYEGLRPEGNFIPLGSLAMSGDRIALVATARYPGAVLVYDLAAGTMTTYSTQALPLGVAINKDFVVWVEYTGEQETPITGTGPFSADYPDSELRGYGFSDRTYYRMIDHRGLQGFPSLSDTLLAWQESANGSSDIYAVRLPQ